MNIRGTNKIAKCIGFFMLFISLIGFYSLIGPNRVDYSAWQAVYMTFVFLGGLLNIIDKGNGKASEIACFCYAGATVFSLIIGIIFRDGIYLDTAFMFIVVVYSMISWNSAQEDRSIKKEHYKGVMDTEKVDGFDEDAARPEKEKNIELLNYAHTILEDIKRNGDNVNTTISVFEFTYSYMNVIEGLKELVRLNEEEGIPMTPPPREDLETIQIGIELTIDKFIDRSIENAKRQGDDAIASVLDFMTKDETFWDIATVKNKEKINKIIQEIEQRRIRTIEELRRIQEKERVEEILNSIGLEHGIDCSCLDPMEVIHAMESKIENLYNEFKIKAYPPAAGEKIFSSFKSACETSKFPLAAEVRLESLLNEYEHKFNVPNPLYFVDNMDGHEFEEWCANLLRRNNFINVEVTRGSGDQGVDVLAEKDGLKYAFQCKCYSSDLGNKPVQEVHAGKYIYQCHVGVVITNRYFTQGAKDAAKATGILLWDRDKLQSLIESAA